MLIPDVNVLVGAFREDAPEHRPLAEWRNGLVNADAAFGVSDLVLAGFLRIVTHPRLFSPPTPLSRALAFTQAFRSARGAVPLVPGERHWAILTRLCREVSAQGNLIPDAWLAALAIESGSEFVTLDGDYARFPGLRGGQAVRRPDAQAIAVCPLSRAADRSVGAQHRHRTDAHREYHQSVAPSGPLGADSQVGLT
jgi:hypothetical protein